MNVHSFSSPYFTPYSNEEFLSLMSMHYDKSRDDIDNYKHRCKLLNSQLKETSTTVEKEIDFICQVLKKNKKELIGNE